MITPLAGLALGFVGSLHCLGMCGPIALVLPGDPARRGQFLLGRVLHGLGRAVTYAFMGAVLGIIGRSIALAGWQQALGVAAGVLMLLSVLLPTRMVRAILPTGVSARVTAAVQRKLGPLLRDATPARLFLVGLLNGALPCGLVYTALAASIAMGDIAGGALFMLLFGLGTTPALTAVSYAAGMMTSSLRRRITRVLPVALAVMGCLFILRGLSLGIPFLSPDINRVTAKMTQAGTPSPGDAKPAQVPAAAESDSVPPCCAP